ncbi:MAG: type II secretion system protein GspD, partial [Planctomycetota bacterium]
PVAGQRLQGGGGLTLEISKLDPFQINALLRAEYQSSKVHQLTAPRVTAANRERVYISVVTQRAYIADYELISGGTGLAVIEVPDPIIETLEEGVVLEVRPTISSDRKYVTLDCRPSLASLVGTANMTAIGVPIGVPQISLQEAFTSVTIPDGGTALLGGFRSLNERTEENSIPFLDNIPLLNVLFRRKAEVREMRNLVILVTAKILNIREEERTRYNSE